MKFQKGIYKIAESKQVDGNMRAVILDENDIRVKDITLKRIKNNPGTGPGYLSGVALNDRNIAGVI